MNGKPQRGGWNISTVATAEYHFSDDKKYHLKHILHALSVKFLIFKFPKVMQQRT